MRVCLVSQEYPPGPPVGGIGTQTQAKALGLVGLGHSVDVITAAGAGAREMTSQGVAGITVHAVPAPGHDVVLYEPQTYWLGYAWGILRSLRSIIATKAYDVIDFPDFAAEGYAFIADRTTDEPAVVVHLHGPLAMFVKHIGWPEPESNFAVIGTAMEDFCITRADYVLASSSAIARFASRTYDVDAEGIEMVSAGVNTDVFFPPEEEPAEPTVLFAGNIALNKGIMTVLEAVVRVRERGHPNLCLIIAGSGDDDLSSEIVRAATKAGAADAVQLLGYVDPHRLAELYRSASLVAAPSQFEGGIGMVCLEAMASGRPVIVGDSGGSPEAVRDGETGFVVAHGDVAATAAAIERLLDEPQLALRLGLAGRRRLEERFSLHRYATRVAEGYERAIERRRQTLGALP